MINVHVQWISRWLEKGLSSHEWIVARQSRTLQALGGIFGSWLRLQMFALLHEKNKPSASLLVCEWCRDPPYSCCEMQWRVWTQCCRLHLGQYRHSYSSEPCQAHLLHFEYGWTLRENGPLAKSNFSDYFWGICRTKEQTHLVTKILEVCPLQVWWLDWPMHLLVWFCTKIFMYALILNVIKEMSAKV